MTLLSGLIYQTPFKHLTDVKHSKKYDAQHKDPSKRSSFGYTIIKLDEDVTYRVGWREDDMKEYHAKKGEYLTQCPMQPPNIIKTWSDLQSTYHVFRNRTQRYRYVLSGIASGDDKLSDFRLIAANNLKPSYSGETALRVRIPEDVELVKWSCDPYSTTDDKRTLDELGYDVLMYDGENKRWVKHNELKHLQPHEMPNLYPPVFNRMENCV